MEQKEKSPKLKVKKKPVKKVVLVAKKEKVANNAKSASKPKSTTTGSIVKRKPIQRTPRTKRTPTPLKPEAEPTDINPNTSVIIPKTAPLRLIRKAQLLNSLFSPQVEKSIYYISYIASICFFLVGSALIISNYLSKDINHLHQFAQLSGSTETITTTQDTTNTSTQPVFNFISTIPDNITETTIITFTVTNAKEVVSKITPVGTTGFISLDTVVFSDGKFKTSIPFDKLAAGYYNLLILVKPSDGTQALSYSSKTFFIGSKEQEEIFNNLKLTDTSTTDTNITTKDISDLDSEKELESGSGDMTITDTTEANATVSTTDKTSTTYTKEPVTDEPINTPVLTSDTKTTDKDDVITSTETTYTFRITSSQKNFSDTSLIDVDTSSRFSFVELYARQTQSRTPFFITLATKRDTVWRFIFDSKNIPNGEYEFFAKSTLDGKEIRSASLIATVFNEPTANAPVIRSSEPVKTVSPDATREFTSIAPTNSISTTTKTVAERQAENLMLDNSSELSDLMQRYSVAIQTGDKTLIKSVENSIEELRSKIVIESLNNTETRYISDDIDEELAKNISDLQERANLFEEVRKQRSNGETATDTDGDGVSDIDEIKIYKTHPELADTDGDGVTDGVEIMGGFDPHSTKAESIITFQSPKESIAIVRDDVLKIEEVTSIILADQPENKSGLIEIKGRSIPNSFVTIYIFSTPTVVTVRTDADGNFVYTLDKELDDGQHDVYVAMTDNKGDIVAQSSAFTFVKDALAITRVNASEGVVTEPVVITESTDKMYRVVVGVGILAFGLILLMLGLTLKPKEEIISDVINVE